MKKGIVVALMVFMASFFTFINTSCKKSSDTSTVDSVLMLNSYIYKVLVTQKYYLWYEQMNKNISPKGYTSGQGYLDAIKYATLDKWSTVLTKSDYESYANGTYYGIGISYRFDEDNALRVSYVIPSSPADKAGIKRGYKITSIGGYATYKIINESLWDEVFGDNAAGVQVKLELQLYDGTTKQFTVTKDVVNEKTVLSKKIYAVAGKTVGYLVFNSFLESSDAELDDAFQYFASNNVSDLVLDLRYNTGGLVSIADTLASYIGGNLNKKVFINVNYNSHYSAYNDKLYFSSKANSLSINNLIIIATKQTASASELIINGLRPYINTKIIGDDTYGKPTGMSVLEYGNYYILPVVEKATNVNGVGDYFSGLTADKYVRDGLDKDFGDETEACLQEALYYLKNGSFSSTVSKKSSRPAYSRGEEPENKLKLVLGAVYKPQK